MIFYSLWWRLQSSLVFNSNIQDSLKKFSLLFRQAEMVFVIVWFFDHFTLEYVPSMNSIWIITFVSHFHVWVTKFKTSLIFFKLSILTSNNVIWVGLFAILFDEAQHVVKTSTTYYVPVSYEVINLFIKPQNFLLIFLICKLWLSRWAIVASFSSMACWCSSFILFVRCCRICGNITLQQYLLKLFAFGCWLENNSWYIPSSLIYRSSFCESLGQLTVVPAAGTPLIWYFWV